MRKSFLLIASLLLTFGSSATVDPQAGTTLTAPLGNPFPHFNSGIGAGAKVGWQGSRLIAKAYAVHNGTHFIKIDSSTYKYGGRRGSSPNLEDPKNDEHVLFNESVTYQFNVSKGKYENSIKRFQGFNKDGKVNDLTYMFWNTNKVPPKWWNKERYLYQYDLSGKMKQSNYELWTGLMWIGHVTSQIVYDGSNNVTKMSSNAYTVSYDYDNNNNLIEVVDEVFDHSTKTWNKNERKSYTYTGSDVKDYTLEVWNKTSNNWVKAERYEYQYNTDKTVSVSIDYTWNGNYWDRFQKNYYTYDANGNRTSLVTQAWDVASNNYINSKREVRVYNTFNQPERIQTFTWYVNTWVYRDKDEDVHFYYEPYDPTSVSPIAQSSKQELNVYPLPASGQINIDLTLDKAKALDINLLDMTGKSVLRMQDNAMAKYHKAIPVTGVPNGSYILSVNTGDALLSKRVIVQH